MHKEGDWWVITCDENQFVSKSGESWYELPSMKATGWGTELTRRLGEYYRQHEYFGELPQ